MRVALAASLVLVSCSYSVTNDYVDFVKANGISYIGVDYFGGGGVGRAVMESDLGPEHLRVKHMLSGEAKGPDYRIADGDSAFVPAGEPVYAVKGYATTFRLAAQRDGRLVLYEADSNPAAKTGRDLLDIEGKVVGIALASGKDARKILGRITDRSRIDDLVRLVLSASVDQSAPPTAALPRTPLPTPTTPIQIRNYGVFVAFELLMAAQRGAVTTSRTVFCTEESWSPAPSARRSRSSLRRHPRPPRSRRRSISRDATTSRARRE